MRLRSLVARLGQGEVRLIEVVEHTAKTKAWTQGLTSHPALGPQTDIICQCSSIGSLGKDCLSEKS